MGCAIASLFKNHSPIRFVLSMDPAFYPIALLRPLMFALTGILRFVLFQCLLSLLTRYFAHIDSSQLYFYYIFQYNEVEELLEESFPDPFTTGQLVSFFFGRRFRNFFRIGPGAASFPYLLDNSFPFLLQSHVKFSILPEIVGTSAYTEADGYGTAEFCMRVGSWDFEPWWRGGQSNLFVEPILINFKQLKVSVTYDLTDEFTVDSFLTEVVASDTVEAEDTFETQSKLCDVQIHTPPFRPGNQICIEVCPADADNQFVDVDSIDTLFMRVQIPDSTNAMIMGVIDPTSPQLSTVLDQVCEEDACCRVRFLLNGDFFPVGVDTAIVDAEDVNQATVTGYGTATVTQFNNERRLVKKTSKTVPRFLQDSNSQAADFDTEFPIQLEAPEDSSAATFGLTGVAAAVGAIGAALLL